jgi:hypothetical protein
VMGLRFRKSVRVAPGVRLNVGLRGVSTSFGRRGATINAGRRGVYTTVGLPGSGLSYRQRVSARRLPRTIAIALAIVVGLTLLGHFIR